MQIIQALLESLAGDWDTAAENLRSDNQALGDLLARSLEAIRLLPERDTELASVVPDIESVLAEPADSSLVISNLTARNDRLRAVLERALVAFEGLIDDPAYADLVSVRRAIHRHLRDVAVRGWSFWDVSSFRQRIEQVRAQSSA